MIGPGIHTITADAYHADPCETPSLSSSIAHVLVTSSPAHARAAHPKLSPGFVRTEDPKFDLGTAAHAFLLEGRDGVAVIDANDWRTAAAKAQREEARALGRIPMLAKDYDRLLDMVEATRAGLDAHEAQPPLLTDGKPEQTIVWEEEGGVVCRALVDWLRTDLATIDDLKTTSHSGEPFSWARNTLFSIGADIQVAFYLRGIEKLTGVRPVWRYILVETFPPFEVSVVTPSMAVMEMGRFKVERALELWRECLANDYWPGYPRTVVEAELPPWIESRWLEQEAREAA